MKLAVIQALGLLVLSGNVLAEDAVKSPWKSAAELGYVNVSGNTNTETVKAVFDLSYEADKWLHKVHADALSSKSETTDTTVTPAVTTAEDTAEKWLVSGQSDYKITDFDYFYALLSYEDDRFSGFEYQSKFGIGYGRRVIHSDNHELKLEVGPGYRMYKLDPVTPPEPAVETQDEMQLRLGAAYAWTISKTSKFTEDLVYEAGEDQDEWKSTTALTANINSTLAMKISRIIKHLETVPAGTKNYDRETSVTLVFTY